MIRNRWVRRPQGSGREERNELSMPSFCHQNPPSEKSLLLSYRKCSKGWGERSRCCSGEVPPLGHCCPPWALLLSPTRFHHGFWSCQGTQQSLAKQERIYPYFLYFSGSILLTESQSCSGWQCSKITIFFPSPFASRGGHVTQFGPMTLTEVS